MIDGLSPDLPAYKRTPVFDETTLPAGLRKRHSTKAGVWGVIHILEGKLLYRTLEPFNEVIADASMPSLIIEPQMEHEVDPVGSVRFYVEFHAEPKKGKGK